MNSVLHLKGQFDCQPNQNRPAAKNLPVRTEDAEQSCVPARW